MTSNSGIFVGPNTQTYWETQEKQNAALGTVVGDGNIISHNVNVIHDNDEVDMPITKVTCPSKKENGADHSTG